LVDDPSASQFLRDNAPVLPTLNRHVADAAPSVKCSPFMTNNTPSPMRACSMPRRKEPTGVRSRGSSWTSTLSGSLIGRAFDSHLERAKWPPTLGMAIALSRVALAHQDRWLTSSDIFCAIASRLPRHAEVVQRDRLTHRERRQRILAIRRGLVDLDVEDEAISLSVGLPTGPSVGSTLAGVEASKFVADPMGPPAPKTRGPSGGVCPQGWGGRRLAAR
jgi:hypothetical protein